MAPIDDIPSNYIQNIGKQNTTMNTGDEFALLCGIHQVLYTGCVRNETVYAAEYGLLVKTKTFVQDTGGVISCAGSCIRNFDKHVKR